MADIFDYVNWRGDISFEISPFNDIDNLIFSEIAYLDYNHVICYFPNERKTSFKLATETLFKVTDKKDIVLGLILPHEIIQLADNIKDCKRFDELYLSNYINEVDVNECYQFSAICFHISDNTIYIAFRGTDDTLVGWQEDLDMVCKFPVPSQRKAAEYVNKIAELYPNCNFIIGGHSKGGNLAIYSAIYCKEEVKDRIIKVYNNDGPGFNKNTINLEKYDLVKDKIVRIIPKESIIGVVLDNFSEKTIIVDSKVKGLYQHDAFKWEVNVDKFITVDKLSDNSVKLDEAITKMLKRMDYSERVSFASNIFQFITIINKSTLIECQKDVFSLLKYTNTLNPKSKKIFMELIYNLIKYKQI